MEYVAERHVCSVAEVAEWFLFLIFVVRMPLCLMIDTKCTVMAMAAWMLPLQVTARLGGQWNDTNSMLLFVAQFLAVKKALELVQSGA